MAEKVKYKATNIETGEVVVGDVNELSKILYASAGAIYRTVSCNTHLGGVWKIEKETFKESAEPKKNYPFNILRDWDRTTKPFKDASRKAGGKNNAIS